MCYPPLNQRKMSKVKTYREIYIQIESVVSGESDLIANMANTAALLHEAFGFWWTGFYIVKGSQLVLGPFQGPVACTRIGFGKGVCGTSWERRETIIVPDVHEFPGHIACSTLSQSEIVVPMLHNNEVYAVLDIDSKELSNFDVTDKKWLEKIVSLLSRDVIIRKARKEDASQIATLLMLAWPVEQIMADIGGTYKQLHDCITEVAASEQTIYSYENTYVAEIDGRAVGAMCGYDGADYQRLKKPIVDVLGKDSGFAQLKETEAGEFYLDSVGVLPEYRGRGIASMLFEAQIMRAESLGHDTVGLIVDVDKPQAEALYTRLGFRHVDDKDFFGHRMKHMVRTLITDQDSGERQ